MFAIFKKIHELEKVCELKKNKKKEKKSKPMMENTRETTLENQT